VTPDPVVLLGGNSYYSFPRTLFQWVACLSPAPVIPMGTSSIMSFPCQWIPIYLPKMSARPLLLAFPGILAAFRSPVLVIPATYVSPLSPPSSKITRPKYSTRRWPPHLDVPCSHPRRVTFKRTPFFLEGCISSPVRHVGR